MGLLDRFYSDGSGSKIAEAFNGGLNPETGFSEKDMRKYASVEKRVGRRAYKDAVKRGDVQKALAFSEFSGVVDGQKHIEAVRERFRMQFQDDIKEGRRAPMEQQMDPEARREQLTLSGAFGTGARDRLRRSLANEMVDRVVSTQEVNQEGALPGRQGLVDQNALSRLAPLAFQIGGSLESFTAAANRRAAGLSFAPVVPNAPGVGSAAAANTIMPGQPDPTPNGQNPMGPPAPLQGGPVPGFQDREWLNAFVASAQRLRELVAQIESRNRILGTQSRLGPASIIDSIGLTPEFKQGAMPQIAPNLSYPQTSAQPEGLSFGVTASDLVPESYADTTGGQMPPTQAIPSSPSQSRLYPVGGIDVGAFNAAREAMEKQLAENRKSSGDPKPSRLAEAPKYQFDRSVDPKSLPTLPPNDYMPGAINRVSKWQEDRRALISESVPGFGEQVAGAARSAAGAVKRGAKAVVDTAARDRLSSAVSRLAKLRKDGASKDSIARAERLVEKERGRLTK